MNEILFIARSVTHAQRMVRALEQCGIRSFLFRAPAGLHCAPLAHRTAGTLDTGTVRLSLSDFNTPAQIEKLAQELHQLFRETVR